MDLCIHAATEVQPLLSGLNAVSHYDSIVTGTRLMLDVPRDNGATRFLLTSTGPLYYGTESVAETDDDRARTD